MLSRVKTLVNVGYGEELDIDLQTDEVRGKSNSFADSETWAKPNLRSSFTDLRNTIQEEYINDEDGNLNRKGGKFLTRLYGNNEEFREEIINFVRDKKELDFEMILDERCKTNTLNTLGNKYLAECITSIDNTKDLIKSRLNIICKARWRTTSKARWRTTNKVCWRTTNKVRPLICKMIR